VTLEDGVSEDEAISVALANNATFRATLTQLGMVEGDVVQAGLLTNPNLQTFIPVGVKQWEWTLFVPLEAFVLRPHRLAVARRDYQRIANTLVQSGLDVVRNARVAHTDLALAIAQAKLANDTYQLRQTISNITERRVQRGDISELDAMTARVDALSAQAAVGVAEQNVAIARARLANVMGLPASAEPITTDSLIAAPSIKPNSEELVAQAMASRPDLQAAEWAIDSATQRSRLARLLFWRFDGIIDANGNGEQGYEMGPGIRFDIPIFNRNQGGIIRAESEIMQARYNRDAIRDQILLDVRTAESQLRQAIDNLRIVRGQILPSLREATAVAEKAFDAGGTPYLMVLQTTTDFVNAQAQELIQTAASRRAFAELERSVGRKLDTESEPSSPELLPPPIRLQELNLPADLPAQP
jgi:cobalt-zinc-cadmium efflux system outer membrane protein